MNNGHFTETHSGYLFSFYQSHQMTSQFEKPERNNSPLMNILIILVVL